MYHLNDDTVCYVQRLDTILNVGDAVQANLLIYVQHSHMVLSIRVPVSMLSTELAAIELAMPRKTSFLHRAFPSVPNM
jgi:predicted RNA-binding protein with RPS1 domain